MLGPKRVEIHLRDLDRRHDPHGGAAAWALLAVGMVLIVGILLAVIWAAGVW